MSSHFTGSDRPPYGPHVAAGPRLESSGKSGHSYAHPGSQLSPMSPTGTAAPAHGPRQSQPPSSSLSPASEPFLCLRHLTPPPGPASPSPFSMTVGVNPHIGVHTRVPRCTVSTWLCTPASPHYTESPTGVRTHVLAQQGPNTGFSSEVCASISMPAGVSTQHACVGVCVRCICVTVYVMCASPSGSVSISTS